MVQSGHTGFATLSPFIVIFLRFFHCSESSFPMDPFFQSTTVDNEIEFFSLFVISEHGRTRVKNLGGFIKRGGLNVIRCPYVYTIGIPM